MDTRSGELHPWQEGESHAQASERLDIPPEHLVQLSGLTQTIKRVTVAIKANNKAMARAKAARAKAARRRNR